MPYRRIHIFVCSNTAKHSDVSKDSGGDDTLDNDKFEYLPWLCSYCLAHSKLACALLHGDEHDVRHTHDTAQKGEQSDDPQCSANNTYTLRHLYVVHVSVPDIHRRLVVGGSVMLYVEMSAIVALEFLVLFFGDKTFYFKLYVPRLITLGIDCFQGGIGDESIIVLLLLVILHYTYHLKHQVTHFYVAPDEREIVMG